MWPWLGAQVFFLLPPFHAKAFLHAELTYLASVTHTHTAPQYVESDKTQVFLLQLCFTILLQADIPANHTRICIPQRGSSGSKNCNVSPLSLGGNLLLSQQFNNLSWYSSKLAQCLRNEVNITWCLHSVSCLQHLHSLCVVALFRIFTYLYKSLHLL